MDGEMIAVIISMALGVLMTTATVVIVALWCEGKEVKEKEKKYLLGTR